MRPPRLEIKDWYLHLPLPPGELVVIIGIALHAPDAAARNEFLNAKVMIAPM
jgi:hypothetical protein